MTHGDDHSTRSRHDQLEAIESAARDAVRDALRRHMLLGESVAVAGEDGDEVRILTPSEIRERLNTD